MLSRIYYALKITTHSLLFALYLRDGGESPPFSPHKMLFTSCPALVYTPPLLINPGHGL